MVACPCVLLTTVLLTLTTRVSLFLFHRVLNPLKGHKATGLNMRMTHSASGALGTAGQNEVSAVQTCLSSALRTRGGVPWKGSFWSDGTQAKVDGYIFNETPPPPGQQRRLESWEIP
jgi:hypothetical protein